MVGDGTDIAIETAWKGVHDIATEVVIAVVLEATYYKATYFFKDTFVKDIEQRGFADVIAGPQSRIIFRFTLRLWVCVCEVCPHVM